MEIHQIMLNTKCKKKRGGEKLTSVIKTDPRFFWYIIQFIIIVIFTIIISIFSVIIFLLSTWIALQLDNGYQLRTMLNACNSILKKTFITLLWVSIYLISRFFWKFSDLLFQLSPFRLRRLRMPHSQISAFLISQITLLLKCGFSDFKQNS